MNAVHGRQAACGEGECSFTIHTSALRGVVGLNNEIRLQQEEAEGTKIDTQRLRNEQVLLCRRMRWRRHLSGVRLCDPEC